MSNWFNKKVAEVLSEFAVDPARGLDSREAARRRERYGPNSIEDSGGRAPLAILFDQFKSLMVLLLIAAALVSGLVLEVGGLLSHGSIIAREFGIPAVVNIDRATERISSGKNISLDGAEGFVELLQ